MNNGNRQTVGIIEISLTELSEVERESAELRCHTVRSQGFASVWA